MLPDFPGAVCAQTDPDEFHPAQGENPVAAKRMCRRCDHRDECLDYAVTHCIPYGVWGGYTAAERAAMRATIRAGAA